MDHSHLLRVMMPSRLSKEPRGNCSLLRISRRLRRAGRGGHAVGRTAAPRSSAAPTPAVTGPLQAAPPTNIDAGPLGTLAVNGVVSGMGLWQSNHVPGDEPTQADLSNGQVFIQKTTGWWQFYVQAGAYDIPSLGLPFVSTDRYAPQPLRSGPCRLPEIGPGEGHLDS